jgi:hypothetical protein
VGVALSSTIENCYAEGTVSGIAENAGFVGQMHLGSIKNAYTKVLPKSGTTRFDAFVFLNAQGVISTSFYSIAFHSNTTAQALDFTKTLPENFQGFNFESTWYFNYPTKQPLLKQPESIVERLCKGLPAGFKPLYYPDDVQSMEKDLTAKYFLCQDLDISHFSFNPIGQKQNLYFTGELNGNNLSITGIRIKSTLDGTGLFFSLQNASIKNLSLKDIDIVGVNQVGALAGFAEPIAGLLVRDSLTAVVQVDGKLRDKFEVSSSITEAELEALAMASVNVQNALAGKQIKNVIVRAPKLVNIATA